MSAEPPGPRDRGGIVTKRKCQRMIMGDELVMTSTVDQLCINTIRTLSIDAVQKANSGHPGTAMAMAPVIYGLWQEFLRSDPNDPLWPNRDHFVLSVGHASMLLYATLHRDLKILQAAITETLA
jgi:transketolase N-terminal domain/subunit